MRRLALVAAVTLAAALLLLDPYSFGRQGGDVWAVRFQWQCFAAGIQGLLLIVSAVGAYLDKRWARGLLLSELCLLVALNVIYLLRDGETRFLIGYESSLRSLWVLSAGIAVRILALGLFGVSPIERNEHGDSNAQTAKPV